MIQEEIFLNQLTAMKKNRNIPVNQNKVQMRTTNCLKTLQKKQPKKFFNKNNKLIKHQQLCTRIEDPNDQQKENFVFL